MSTLIENRRPANSLSITRLVARHPVAAFLLLAFVIGWSAFVPLLLSENGTFAVLPIELPWKPFGSLMSIFGLALPAFLVTAATGGKEGVRDLVRRIFRWRVGIHWYLIALFGLLAVTLLGAIPFVLLQVGVLAVFAIFIRLLIMWLYNSTGRSVLLVALFHSAFNMTSSNQNITPALVPSSAAALIPAAAVAVLAVLVVVLTRGRLGYEPERAKPWPIETGALAAQQSAQ